VLVHGAAAASPCAVTHVGAGAKDRSARLDAAAAILSDTAPSLLMNNVDYEPCLFSTWQALHVNLVVLGLRYSKTCQLPREVLFAAAPTVVSVY